MRRILAGAFGLALVLAGSLPLSAKGATSKITISGGGLSAPIEIRDPELLKPFQVWSGPGVRRGYGGVFTEETEGFIIDWPSGFASIDPSALQQYQVSFYVNDKRAPANTAPSEELAHVVTYACDPISGRDYVYLPGQGDEWYELNMKHMPHNRLEGHWFGATAEWQQLARSLLAGTVAARRAD